MRKEQFAKNICTVRASAETRNHTLCAGEIILLVFACASHDFAVAQCAPAGPYSSAANNIVRNPGVGKSLNTLGGSDSVTINGGAVTSIDKSTGKDSITITGGTLGIGNLFALTGDATIDAGATLLASATGLGGYAINGMQLPI